MAIKTKAQLLAYSTANFTTGGAATRAASLRTYLEDLSDSVIFGQVPTTSGLIPRSSGTLGVLTTDVGYTKVRPSATMDIRFSDQTGVGVYGTIYVLPPAGVELTTNYLISSESTHIYLNAPSVAGEVRLRVNNDNQVVISTSAVMSKNNIFVGGPTTSPTARVDMLAADASTPQLRLRDGATDVAAPAMGSVWCNTTNGFTLFHTRKTFIGPWVSLAATHNAIYFHQTPGSLNPALAGNDSNTIVNVNTGGELSLQVANSKVQVVTSSRVNFVQKVYIGDGTTSPTARLHVIESSADAPVLKYETEAGDDNPAVTVYQNKVSTTNAVAALLHRIDIPASTTVLIKGYVIARRTGGASGSADDGAAYEIRALYKNAAGVATAIGAPTVTVIGESVAAYNCALTPVGNQVSIEVTGVATTNITWHLSELKVMKVSI